MGQQNSTKELFQSDYTGLDADDEKESLYESEELEFHTCSEEVNQDQFYFSVTNGAPLFKIYLDKIDEPVKFYKSQEFESAEETVCHDPTYPSIQEANETETEENTITPKKEQSDQFMELTPIRNTYIKSEMFEELGRRACDIDYRDSINDQVDSQELSLDRISERTPYDAKAMQDLFRSEASSFESTQSAKTVEIKLGSRKSTNYLPATENFVTMIKAERKNTNYLPDNIRTKDLAKEQLAQKFLAEYFDRFIYKQPQLNLMLTKDQSRKNKLIKIKKEKYTKQIESEVSKNSNMLCQNNKLIK